MNPEMILLVVLPAHRLIQFVFGQTRLDIAPLSHLQCAGRSNCGEAPILPVLLSQTQSQQFFARGARLHQLLFVRCRMVKISDQHSIELPCRDPLRRGHRT